MTARKPESKAALDFPPHPFAPKEGGLLDWNNQPMECEVCPYLPKNGVHKTAEELTRKLFADLPPTPPEAAERDARILGEND